MAYILYAVMAWSACACVVGPIFGHCARVMNP